MSYRHFHSLTAERKPDNSRLRFTILGAFSVSAVKIRIGLGSQAGQQYQNEQELIQLSRFARAAVIAQGHESCQHAAVVSPTEFRP
jgi:hypothetical protein